MNASFPEGKVVGGFPGCCLLITGADESKEPVLHPWVEGAQECIPSQQPGRDGPAAPFTGISQLRVPPPSAADGPDSISAKCGRRSL